MEETPNKLRPNIKVKNQKGKDRQVTKHPKGTQNGLKKVGVSLAKAHDDNTYTKSRDAEFLKPASDYFRSDFNLDTVNIVRSDTEIKKSIVIPRSNISIEELEELLKKTEEEVRRKEIERGPTLYLKPNETIEDVKKVFERVRQVAYSITMQ
ncbi:tRNA:m(4)X modification enzyme TRM13 [Acrasis kona]|uniref:tRNA:m(4)X modification enzyme TRM13 n=1 Tax=Acrasis kona TaxID=1008807 RepID=A0AAW2ZPG9_9EUKA